VDILSPGEVADGSRGGTLNMVGGIIGGTFPHPTLISGAIGGLVLLLIAIIAGIYFFLRRRYRKHRKWKQYSAMSETPSDAGSGFSQNEMKSPPSFGKSLNLLNITKSTEHNPNFHLALYL
jgi:hypothetical protein